MKRLLATAATALLLAGPAAAVNAHAEQSVGAGFVYHVEYRDDGQRYWYQPWPQQPRHVPDRRWDDDDDDDRRYRDRDDDDWQPWYRDSRYRHGWWNHPHYRPWQPRVLPVHVIVYKLQRHNIHYIREAQLRGHVYRVKALDWRGRPMVLIVDAYTGQILDRRG
jgi:hypothetical protein